MKTTPIIFNSDMVCALLEGRKTQTRRPIDKETVEFIEFMSGSSEEGEPASADNLGLMWGESRDDNDKIVPEQWLIYCSEYPEEGVIPIGAGYGRKGDLLWVRETWNKTNPCGDGVPYYRADGRFPDSIGGRDFYGDEAWKPSIHMPRWVSRLTLRLTGVRIERVHDMHTDDAVAEGCPQNVISNVDIDPVNTWYASLWDTLYGNWNENPWVWVLEFEVVTQNIDQVLALMAQDRAA